MQIADFIKFCYPGTLRTDAVRSAKELVNHLDPKKEINLSVLTSREVEVRQKAESLCLTINVIKEDV